MKNEETLHITLKKQWFDLIKAGIKPEEYREIKPYWIKRLCKHQYHDETPEYLDFLANVVGSDIFNNSFGKVSANNGYAKDCPNVKWQHKGIRIGQGNPEWGAVPGVNYFILEIGEILSK